MCVVSPTAYAVLSLAAVGVTAGAHRLWCHRSYKAKWPLRLLLCIFQTAAFQVQSVKLICYISSFTEPANDGNRG
jgi:fatty-acid desaturase